MVDLPILLKGSLSRMLSDREIWLHPFRTYRDYRVKRERYTSSTEDLISLFQSAGITDAEMLSRLIMEVHSDGRLYSHLQSSLGTTSLYDSKYNLSYKAEILYLVVRTSMPDYVIETGVSAGISSTFILQALMRNNRGRLFSIDLPPEKHHYGRYYSESFGRTSGWAVPEHLRERWSLFTGSSRHRLREALEGIGKVDLFVHDSLHTYNHQMFEYNTVWPYLKPNGLLISDDMGLALIDFAKRIGSRYYAFREIGLIRKA